MSTRSGKRIHSSVDDDHPVNEDTVLQTERKTRAKKLKENLETSTKKKNNYVSYPAEEDASNPGEPAEKNDKKRRTRRYTLKEHNIDVLVADSDNNSEIKTIRKSRRGKKIVEDVTEKAGSVSDIGEDKGEAEVNPIRDEQSNGDVNLKEADSVEDNESNNGAMFKDKPEKVETISNKSKKKKDVHLKSTESVDVYGKDIEDSEAKSVKSAKNMRKTASIEQTGEVCVNNNHANTGESEIKTVIKEKKKSKKKKNRKRASVEPNDKENLEAEVAIKNKVAKKKRKSNSFIVEPVEQNKKSSLLERSNMSIDSFHSAAGSPVNGASPDDDNAISKNKSVQESVDEPKLNITIDKTTLNNTFEKETKTKRKSSIKNSTFDKMEINCDTNEIKDATFEKNYTSPRNTSFDKVEMKRRSSKVGTISAEQVTSLNTTFDKTLNGKVSTKSLNATFDKESAELNITFDAETPSIDKPEKETVNDSNDFKKSSLISSDATINVTFDRSNDRISITSDDSRMENIMNHTPVLIESSLDVSRISEDSKHTPERPADKAPLTPLKREGTFTKDDQDVLMSPKRKDVTPNRRKSLPSPGFTPFPFTKSSQKEKCMLNVTRSIEKSLRRSSLAEIVPRQTKVMFCSPVNNPAVVMQMKGKVIKSNLKGSNKSFVFDDGGKAPAGPRRRARTQGAARRAGGAPLPGERLARARTLSAAAKLPEAGSPSKKAGTPSKPQPERARTKLPNFAALHQKQFDKMESLDECQERKAKRARQLLTPTGSVTLIERTSPKDPATNPPPAKSEPRRMFTPSKGPLESLNPGYTRFGFKLNMDANPFSVHKKLEPLQKEKRSNGVLRQTTCLALPSLAGATASRLDVAKHAVMREKSIAEKRDVKRKENRTVIKGVRTNRRFELQMKMRNINA